MQQQHINAVYVLGATPGVENAIQTLFSNDLDAFEEYSKLAEGNVYKYMHTEYQSDECTDECPILNIQNLMTKLKHVLRTLSNLFGKKRISYWEAKAMKSH